MELSRSVPVIGKSIALLNPKTPRQLRLSTVLRIR